MSFLQTVKRSLEIIFEYFTMLLLSVMLFIVPLQVFCRFVLKSSLQWPDELSPYLLAWLTFTGAVLAMKNNEHLGFDVIVNRTTGKLRLGILLLKEVIILFFLFVLVYYSFPIIKIKWPDYAYTILISKGLIYTCLPLGGTLMFFLSLSNLWKTIQEFCREK